MNIYTKYFLASHWLALWEMSFWICFNKSLHFTQTNTSDIIIFNPHSLIDIKWMRSRRKTLNQPTRVRERKRVYTEQCDNPNINDLCCVERFENETKTTQNKTNKKWINDDLMAFSNTTSKVDAHECTDMQPPNNSGCEQIRSGWVQSTGNS